MEKERGGKTIAIVALLIGVVGLTIGFAAFSNTLTIRSSAEYTPDDSIFNVDFSSTTGSVVDGNLAPTTLTPATNGPTGATATIDNSSDPVITGIKATFTEPGQSVVYEFYTRNAGQMKAFLRSVTFGNASPAAGTANGLETVGSGFKTCTQLNKTNTPATDNPATVTTMTAACEDINLTLKVGTNDTMTGSTVRTNFVPAATAHDLEVSGEEKVTLTISYPAGSDRADGDFTVNFGDITFVYASTAADE